MALRIPLSLSMIILTAALLPAAVWADDPPRDRAEQLEFDPQTGQWIEIEPPEPGTPEGDLAIARRHLADGHTGRARKAFKKWLKNHGEAHALAREARLGLAAVELGDRNYYKAYGILDPLAAEFGTDDVTLQAVEMEFVVAEVFLSGTKRKWLGMRIRGSKDLGIKILDDITFNYPDTGLAEKALKTKADHYFQRGDFDLAEDEYASLITSFPRSQWLLAASLRRAQATLAQFPGTDFDDAALIEAEERFLRFRTEYPQAAQPHDVDLILEDIRNRRAQKEFEIGQYYAKVGQDRASAFYYRSVIDNWPGTVAATQAIAVLAQMGLFREASTEPATRTLEPLPDGSLTGVPQ